MDNFVLHTTKHQPQYHILVDLEDEWLLDAYYITTIKSSIHSYTRYVCCREKLTNKYIGVLHRLILNAPPDMLVDHKNGNGLDCRRHNIRFATYSQNAQNSRNQEGKIKGVSYRKDRFKWHAYISLNNKMTNLGYFLTQAEAITARVAAEEKYFKEFNGLGTQQVEY